MEAQFKQLSGDPEYMELVIDTWKATMDEINIKRTAEGPFSRSAVDAKFGRGRWRPSPCYGVRQNGKVRAIHDAKRSLINSAYQNLESVHMMDAKFPGAVGRRIFDLYRIRSIPCPRVGASVNDEPHAYRNTPSAQPGFSVAAVISPSGKVHFVIFRGHIMGAGASVPNYCEKSSLLSICATAFLAVPNDAFVDDFTVVETELSRGQAVGGVEGWEDHPYSAEAGLWRMTKLLNSPLAVEKRAEWSIEPVACGVCTIFTNLQEAGEVRMRIKETTRTKTREIVRECLASGKFGVGIHSKLVGKLGYIMITKAGRAALQPLIQGEEGAGDISSDQRSALELVQSLLDGGLPDAIVHGVGRNPAPFTVFSDASEEPPIPPMRWPSGRVAFIVFYPDGRVVFARRLYPTTSTNV